MNTVIFAEEERRKWQYLPHDPWTARFCGAGTHGLGNVCRKEGDEERQGSLLPSELFCTQKSPTTVLKLKCFETVSMYWNCVQYISAFSSGAMWSLPFPKSFPWLKISDPVLFSTVFMCSILWFEFTSRNCFYLILASTRLGIPGVHESSDLFNWIPK